MIFYKFGYKFKDRVSRIENENFEILEDNIRKTISKSVEEFAFDYLFDFVKIIYGNGIKVSYNLFRSYLIE
jgi:hypothetical protein